MKNNLIYLLSFLLIGLSSCKKDPAEEPKIIFKVQFDPTLPRLNSFGQEATIPSDHAAQNPVFNKLSAHYVELSPNAYTALGAGEVLYLAPELSIGGQNAIDFSKSVSVGHNEAFFSLPIKEVAVGTYEWLRVSLAYQNYDIDFRITNPLDTTQNLDLKGTVASFIGYNTYINSYVIKNQSKVINAAKKQGYWGFETTAYGQTYVTDGQAPAGATTVVNPLFASSPIPAGSCVVTAQFDSPLQISGEENENIIVNVRLSTNKSFEWNDAASPDGVYQPDKGDFPVDMGIRGMETNWIKE